MPAPKPAQVRDQVIALAKEGHAVRVIESILAKRKVKVGKSAIAEIVRQFRSGALPDPAAKAPRPAPAPTGPGPAPPPETTPPPAAGPVFDPGAVADLDLEKLVELATLFDDRMRGAVKTGDVRLAGWLLASRRTVSQEIARLRPPVLPDPAKDPGNLVARDALRARLESAVAAYQASDAGLAQLRAHVARAEERAAPRSPLPAVDVPEGASLPMAAE